MNNKEIIISFFLTLIISFLLISTFVRWWTPAICGTLDVITGCQKNTLLSYISKNGFNPTTNSLVLTNIVVSLIATCIIWGSTSALYLKFKRHA